MTSATVIKIPYSLSFVTNLTPHPLNKENTRLISEKIRSFVQIEFIMAKKVDYLIALINEFGRHYGLTDRDAYRYLKQYGFISIYEDCYEYLHTQSFESAAEELAGFCRRNGGQLA